MIAVQIKINIPKVIKIFKLLEKYERNKVKLKIEIFCRFVVVCPLNFLTWETLAIL
jgi:hypothetical protein